MNISQQQKSFKGCPLQGLLVTSLNFGYRIVIALMMLESCKHQCNASSKL